MNTPLILKISAAILLGGLPTARGQAAKDGKLPELPAIGGTSYDGAPSIGCSHNGTSGNVTFKNQEVWKGKVRKGLRAIVKTVEGTDYAAAWDGKKLVWQNVPGAGDRLKDDLRKLLKKERKLD